MATKVDVAIVGAGPGGAAAANSIRKVAPNLNVKIFERARQLQRVGFSIGVMENGLSALDAIGPDVRSRVDSIALPDGEVGRYNVKGEEFARTKSPADDPGQYKAIMVPWWTLQRTLLELLPADTLQLDHALSTIDLHPAGGATLRFHSHPPVEASIVIGCDGNQSAVRRSLLQDAPPRYAGRAVWRGQTPLPGDWPYMGDRSSWFIDFATGTGVHTYQMGDGYLGWTAIAGWPEEEVGALGSGRYVETEGGKEAAEGKLPRCMEALRRVEGWPEVVLDTVAGTDASTVAEHGMFYREPDECTVWGRGPATLLGDAAHLCSPFLGQGLNQALEDAVELGRAIGEHGATEEALRQYEAVRQPRMRRVQEGSWGLLKSYMGGGRANEAGWHRENEWLSGVVVEPLVAAQAAAEPAAV